MTRDSIEGLIPHAGAMCLLDRIVDWTPDRITLLTGTHRASDNPLRHHGRLRSIHLCEYGAQAMAVHGGLQAQAAGTAATPGLLVSLRDVVLATGFVDQVGGDLLVEAVRLQVTEAGWQYEFSVSSSEGELARGRAVVAMQSRPNDVVGRDP